MRPGRPSSTSSAKPVVRDSVAPPHCPSELLPRDRGITRKMRAATRMQVNPVAVWIDRRSIDAAESKVLRFVGGWVWIGERA